jgi:hypothetical protein
MRRRDYRRLHSKPGVGADLKVRNIFDVTKVVDVRTRTHRDVRRMEVAADANPGVMGDGQSEATIDSFARWLVYQGRRTNDVDPERPPARLGVRSMRRE